jgi:hypothetical protein
MLHIRTVITSIGIVSCLAAIAMSLKSFGLVYRHVRTTRQLSRSLRLVVHHRHSENDFMILRSSGLPRRRLTASAGASTGCGLRNSCSGA